MSRRAAKIIGVSVGLTLAVFLTVYLPMSSNYAECGSVFLCR